MRAITTLLLCVATALAVCASPRKQTTARSGLKTAPTTSIPNTGSNSSTATDTIVPDTACITIAGYDKPANATKETFFVVNNTDRTITGLTITLNYTDMQGRQLHQATHTISCSIPPRQTRMTAVPSWDRQPSFHYHLGATPRKQSTPYDVSCSISQAILTR